jgi:hypothetical protein
MTELNITRDISHPVDVLQIRRFSIGSDVLMQIMIIFKNGCVKVEYLQ